MNYVTVGPDWLTPAEVAALFRVAPKTVSRWADQGILHPIRTGGGHRRYRRTEIEKMLNERRADDLQD